MNKLKTAIFKQTKMIKIKKIVLSFLLLATTYSFGQELNLPVFTQYLADNHFVILLISESRVESLAQAD